jgi:cell division protein FtsN
VADKPKSDGRFFVLILGVLIGFVIGFVVLLSRLPVDNSISNFNSSDVEPVALGDIDFDYYTVLPEQTALRRQRAVQAPAAPPVQRARVLPDPGQPRVSALARKKSENSRKVPLSSQAGKSSYFLQAGTYLRSDDAERARMELLRLGLEAIIVIRQNNRGDVTHKVRIGPFVDQKVLDSARVRLKNGGIPFQVVRITG